MFPDPDLSHLLPFLILLGGFILGIRYIAGLIRITEENPRRREAAMLNLLVVAVLALAVFLILINCTYMKICKF